jgi:hypothetical protein
MSKPNLFFMLAVTIGGGGMALDKGRCFALEKRTLPRA